MSERPDPLIRAALRGMEVPEHEPGFWERLEARLEEQQPLQALLEQRVPAFRPITVLPGDDGAVAPPGGSRSRAARVAGIAAVAAAVAVLVATTGLLRPGDRREDIEVAGLTSAPTEAARGSAAADSALRRPGTGAPGVAITAADDPVEVVTAWLRALGEGDTATAWDLLGPHGRELWGSERAFASEASALAEGYGAWASVDPDLVLETPLPPAGTAEGAALVTLVGDLRQEGGSRRAVLVVAVAPDGARGSTVDPSPVSAQHVGLVQPAPPAPDGALPRLDADDELVVDLPSDCGSAVLRLDDDAPVQPGDAAVTTAPRRDGTTRVTYLPGRLDRGEHVLTVGCVDPASGLVFTSGALFEAA